MKTVNKIKSALVLTTITTLVGCTTVADMAGYDTAT